MARLVTATLLTLAALAILSSAHAQSLEPEGRYPAATGFSYIGYDTALDAKDRAILVARVGTPPSRTVLATRLNPDGSLDPDYSGFSVPGFDPTARVAIDDMDVATVAGSIRPFEGGERFPYVGRILEDGTPDPSFGTDGVLTPDLGSTAEVTGLALSGGRVLLGLHPIASGSCSIAALTPEGHLDTGFGSDGFAVFSTGAARCTSRDLLATDDGLYLLGRYQYDGQDAVSFVGAFNLDGSLKSKFGQSGRYLFGDTDAGAEATTLGPWNGRLAIAGSFEEGGTAGVFAFALRLDGEVDATFNGGTGSFRGAVTGAPNSVRISLTDAAGSLVLATSVRESTYVHSLFATVFDASGTRIPQSGPDGSMNGFYREIRTTDTFRVYTYATFGAVTDSAGRVVLGEWQTASGSSFRRSSIARFDLVTPALALDFKLLSSNEVPNEGGGVRVRAKVTNEGSTAASPDLWAIATFPDGTNTSTVIRPRPRAIDAGSRYAKRYRIRVPKNAPDGEYTLTYFVGTFPDQVVASEALPLVKLPPAAGASAPTGTDWQLTLEEASVPLALAPNPTRGDTWLTLGAPATVTVRDALGREVLHQTTEAGRLGLATAGLAPGVYSVLVDAEAGRQTARLTVVR